MDEPITARCLWTDPATGAQCRRRAGHEPGHPQTLEDQPDPPVVPDSAAIENARMGAAT